jgi:hypothetical protein
MTRTLTSRLGLALVLLGITGMAMAGDYGDRVEHRLDVHGDRVEHRLDVRSDHALANGHPVRAARLDRTGDRVDRRLDRRGARFDRRWDRRH